MKNCRERKHIDIELCENCTNRCKDKQTVFNLVQERNQLSNVRNEKMEEVILRSKYRYMDLGQRLLIFFVKRKRKILAQL